MCGLAGVVSNSLDLEDNLNQMIHSLHHRGPDNSSFEIYKNLGLGHARLSIIDLSSLANQPMTDFTGQYSIIFNGEIYNYKELKKNLLGRGCRFNNKSDTEVILNGYILDGISFFKKIRGFFALVIYDKQKNELLLARDSHGKKPLFYTLKDQNLFFASELKAIIPQLHHTPDLNYSTLSHYLWKGYFANTDSIYSGIKSVEPGGAIYIDLKTVKIKKSTIYQSVDIEVGRDFPTRKIETIENSLISAINYRLIADVPISFLLSGGVDSSLITYLAGLDNTIDTYYLGYKDKDDPFEGLSKLVAQKIQSKHHIHKMGKPVFGNSLSKMIDLFDEPFADYSALPSYEIYKIISNKTKVAISGDGADEIFCGYKDAKLFLIKSWLSKINFQKKNISSTDVIFNLLNSRFKSMRVLGNVSALAFIDEGLFSTTTFRGGWNNAYRKNYMTKEGYALTLKDHTENSEINSYMSSGENTLERYLNYELKKLTYDFLVKVDRSSMANSLEVRSPYLDTEMIKEINGVNYQSLMSIKKTKKELKSLLKGYGLEEVAKTPKMGFTPPLGSWMISESGISEINNMVDSPFINTLFDKKKLITMTTSEDNIINNQGRLWNLMVLNTWHSRNYS